MRFGLCCDECNGTGRWDDCSWLLIGGRTGLRLLFIIARRVRRGSGGRTLDYWSETPPAPKYGAVLTRFGRPRHWISVDAIAGWKWDGG